MSAIFTLGPFSLTITGTQLALYAIKVMLDNRIIFSSPNPLPTPFCSHNLCTSNTPTIAAPKNQVLTNSGGTFSSSDLSGKTLSFTACLFSVDPTKLLSDVIAEISGQAIQLPNSPQLFVNVTPTLSTIPNQCSGPLTWTWLFDTIAPSPIKRKLHFNLMVN